MKVLRGTLTFVLGIIIGIILFVVAIGGTLAILATQFTVGELQNVIIGSDNVISSDSDVYNKTIFDAVKDIVKDVQNFNNLSLKTLYEHYGIKLLNGISGIDFTDKNFYTVPITELVNDLSIVVNSFTLNDVSKIAGVDFTSYGLPILNNNLNNNLSTAMDNILGSLNGNLSIRAINDNFGIDLGVQDNALLANLQDVVLSEFGNVMSALRVSAILEADSDTFVPYDADKINYFAKTDEYEAIAASELASRTPRTGVETSQIGGLDSDGNGTADTLEIVETRYVQITDTSTGEEITKYVVDNSSYAEDFDAAANEKTFYRHILYTPTNLTEGENIYVLGFANRIDAISDSDFTLLEKGFFAVSELEFSQEIWAIADDVLDKDSKLTLLEDEQTEGKTFRRVHTGSSTALLQSIAHMTIAELQDADNLLDGLTIGDVVDITPESAKIMKSLAARNCKLTELGTVANDLTLGEMIDVRTYQYEKSDSGKYVRIEDENAFTLYDKTNPDHETVTRYKKTADGFVPDAKGKFVRSIYYTLYNPAEHTQTDRYNRIPLESGETVSSTLLQRFTGATLGKFSDAFDTLMLADVMQIDADVYEPVSLDYIHQNDTERFFYYDRTNSVYRVAHSEYIEDHPDLTYYHIAYSGEGTSFIKKLAYVKIDGMADAMDIIIDDMMLSEFIDIYNEHAVELSAHTGAFKSDAKYFMEYGAGGNAHEAEDGTKYVYVYDKFGDYAKSNFRPVEVTQNVTDTTIYFRYVKFSDMTGSAAEKAQKLKQLSEEGNVYYLDNGEYKRNFALCTYMLTKPEYHSHVYYREKVSASGADVFSGNMKTYVGTTLPYGLFVKDDFLGYLAYDVNNPVFADKPLLTFEKAAGEDYYINKGDVKHIAAVVPSGEFVSRDLYYARRQCIDVYVLTAATENAYIFVDGQYVKYDGAVHETTLQRFERKIGYIGEINEVSYNDGANTDFIVQDVNFIRERSTPVLRMLARGTIGEMNTVIGNATVGDVVEAEPDSMLDKPVIKNAKLTELGNVFKDILTSMTIGELMTWSNVTEVEDYVKIALQDITVQALFSSLTLDKTTQEIKVDMLKLYGYKIA